VNEQWVGSPKYIECITCFAFCRVTDSIVADKKMELFQETKLHHLSARNIGSRDTKAAPGTPRK
jgi:hypothetical protein